MFGDLTSASKIRYPCCFVPRSALPDHGFTNRGEVILAMLETEVLPRRLGEGAASVILALLFGDIDDILRGNEDEELHNERT